MNEKEQKVAESLLEKIQTANTPGEAVQLAEAYATLAQVGFNRVHAMPKGINPNSLLGKAQS